MKERSDFMNVIYREPKENTHYQWEDHNGIHNIWYTKITPILNFKHLNIPFELNNFLDKWKTKMENTKPQKIRDCNLSTVEFIYQHHIYELSAATFIDGDISLLNEEQLKLINFLFSKYKIDIIDELEEELGVKYYRYCWLEQNK